MARRKRRHRPRQQEEDHRTNGPAHQQRASTSVLEPDSSSRRGTHQVIARQAHAIGPRSPRVPLLTVPKVLGSNAHHTPRGSGGQLTNKAQQVGRGRNPRAKRQQLLNYLHSVVEGGTAQLQDWQLGFDNESEDEECPGSSEGKMDWQPEAEIRIVFLDVGAARTGDTMTSKSCARVGDLADGTSVEHEALRSRKDELMGRISVNGYGVEDRNEQETLKGVIAQSAVGEEVH